MNPLACPACGFANEENRVFCQNCGTRLEVPDKPAAGAPTGHAERAPASPYGRTRPPLTERQKSHAPTRGWTAALLTIVQLLVMAALLAVIIQMLRPPDSLPPEVQASETLASRLAADMHAARENTYPRAMEITTGDANNFLAARVIGGTNQLGSSLVRCYVQPDGELTRFGAQQRLLKFPVYLEVRVKPVSSGKSTTAEVVAASVGRLTLPSPLIPLVGRSLFPVLEALRGPVEWLTAAGKIQPGADGWTVMWPGTGAE